MSIITNKKLFAAWSGLVMSGYDLFAKYEDTVLMCKSIKNLLYDKDSAEYFAFARTNEIECNPYFPRASNLSVFCFYDSNAIKDYESFLTSCGDIEHIKENFRNWIKKCDHYLERIISKPYFEELFSMHETIVQKKFYSANLDLQKIIKKLEDNGFKSDIKIVVVPNLLQSPFLVDYVTIKNTLYVICAEMSTEAIVHEYLHIFAKRKRADFSRMIMDNGINAYVDVDKMMKDGYMKDFSIESQIHAMEENFVRNNTQKILES